jgi:hypothetical protein
VSNSLKETIMENLATHTKDEDKLKELDEKCRAELQAAGIKPFDRIVRVKGEVPTRIMGSLHGWGFERAWYYWVANGPGIPPVYANKLHETHGQEVRVDGHCGCPSPLEWCKGFAVGHYHVDTAEGLKALADTIKLIIKEASNESSEGE